MAFRETEGKLPLSDRIDDILARAAPPTDRASIGFFVPCDSQDAKQIDLRYNGFIQATAGGNANLFQALLENRGVSLDWFKRGLVDVRVSRLGQNPPAWAIGFLRFLNAQDTTLESDAEVAHSSLSGITKSFQRAACAAVRGASRRMRSVEISPSAKAALHAHLIKRLSSATYQAIGFELHVKRSLTSPSGATWHYGATAELDCTKNGWIQRCELLPGLAFVVGSVYRQWELCLAELLERLERDWELLRCKLWAGRHAGSVSNFIGDAGDVHCGGRSVAILEFSSGDRVVYKPKDLRSCATFQELIKCLSRDAEIGLRARELIVRPGYCWEQYINNDECQSKEEVSRYFFRMGMAARLLELLEGRDFWLDNVIACGETPYLIDTETVLQPRFVSAQDPPARALYDAILESVVFTGLISLPTFIGEDVRAEDLGALTSQRQYLSPFRREEFERKYYGNNRETSPEGYNLWSHVEHTPRLRGQPCDAAMYFSEVLNGYHAMHRSIVAAVKSRRGEFCGIIESFNDLLVRVIYRNTWAYYKILDGSVAPATLVDGIAREMYFERLYHSMSASKFPLNHAKIVQSEIDALREMNVPIFWSKPARSAMYRTEGEPLQEIFEGTAMSRLTARIRKLNEAANNSQEDLLRSSFACGYRRFVSTRTYQINPGRRPISWLAEATRVADSIIKYAHRHPTGYYWIGVTYRANLDMLHVDVLASDLLSGGAGLAVVFGDLFAETRCTRFAEAARGAVAGVIQSLSRRSSERIAKVDAPDAIRRGQPSGIAEEALELYALQRTATALHDPALIDLYCVSSAACGFDIERRVANNEVVDGLLCYLLVVSSAGKGADRQLTALLGNIVNLCVRKIPLFCGGTLFGEKQVVQVPGLLKGLPTNGAAMKLLGKRLQTILPEVAGELRSALANQNFGAGGDSIGEVLGFVAAGEFDHPFIAEQIRRKVDFCSQHRACDDLDALELCLVLHGVTGDVRYLDRAAEFGMRMVWRYDMSGSWFPEYFASDAHNLSAIWGLGAVAHAFLRLNTAGRYGSIRLLE